MRKKTVSAFGPLLCGSLLALVLSSCSVFSSREVRVNPASQSVMQEYFYNSMFNRDGLSFDAGNFLKSNLIGDELFENPENVLQKLDEYYRISGNLRYPQIAADLCRWMARRCEPERALKFHLTALKYCRVFIEGMTKNRKLKTENIPFDITVLRMILVYNEVCAGVFQYQKTHGLLGHDSFSLQGIDGIRFVFTKPVHNLAVPPETITSVSLCATYSVEKMRQINRKAGFGAPLTVSVASQNKYKFLKTPEGMTIPVTYLIFMNRLDFQTIEVKQVYLDTNLSEEISTPDTAIIPFAKLPLAADFTTPLACFSNAVPDRNVISVMLNRNAEDKASGLYMLETYNPAKIPVVFIHGLMSTPSTWLQMVNSLKTDPNIRKRYQFWFFSYSTGAPVLLSAKKLRDALRAAEKEFCTTPEATANFNKMVLVGHSMGGLLTRQMVQENPRYLFETIYGLSYDEIKARLQPEDFELFDSLTPYPLPFVHRAVFMAVPHKGAEMAQSFLGKLGTYLITAPKYLLTRSEAIVRINTALMADYGERMAKRGNRFFTGIDNLDPDNSFVRANGVSPMKKDLTYHCIIGNHNRAGAPDESDGIVPYWSSHLDGAASELIVKSDHSVHRRPAAIQELLRILLLHLKEVDKNS